MVANIVFIDARVPDGKTLVSALPADTLWYRLDAGTDGIAQMRSILSGVHDLSSIQILSHGDAGTLYLGNSVINGVTLSGYVSALSEIGQSLSASGDLLLYGCDVGQGDVGAAFVQELARYTGADIAASNDITGAASLGGDWALEVTSGSIEAPGISAMDWAGTLAVINGDNQDNILIGTSDPDTISGFAGNDTINGLAGADTMIGGTGNDTYYVDTQLDQVIEKPGEGVWDTVYTAVQDYVLHPDSDIEALVLMDGVQHATGNTSSNVIYGNDSGNLIDGGGGADILIGGNGNDIYFVHTLIVQVIETPTGGAWDNVYVDTDGYVLPANVEALVLETGAISGSGNSAGNVIYGNDAANVIDGGGGGDALLGGNGNDTYYVHSTADQVTETATGGIWDTIYTDVENFVLPGNVEALVLMNSVVQGRGNSAPNAIYGNDAANILDGGGGGDALLGGNGNDTYYVRATSDQVTETATGGVWDTVYAYVDYTLPFNVEAMVLALNTLHGTGNSAANALYVQGANDIVTGGGGNDTFFFHAGFGDASITDFNSAEGDSIDLHNTFSTFGQLQANTQQVGANTVITWTGQDVLTLQNVAASSLTAGDFHLS